MCEMKGELATEVGSYVSKTVFARSSVMDKRTHRPRTTLEVWSEPVQSVSGGVFRMVVQSGARFASCSSWHGPTTECPSTAPHCSCSYDDSAQCSRPTPDQSSYTAGRYMLKCAIPHTTFLQCIKKWPMHFGIFFSCYQRVYSVSACSIVAWVSSLQFYILCFVFVLDREPVGG